LPTAPPPPGNELLPPSLGEAPATEPGAPLTAAVSPPPPATGSLLPPQATPRTPSATGAHTKNTNEHFKIRMDLSCFFLRPRRAPEKALMLI
jgi:hypothetical protein